MLLLILASTVAMATAANTGCCTPDTWEADNLFVMGALNNGANSLIEGKQRTSFDSVNKLVAVSQALNVNTQDAVNVPVMQRVILDYNQAMSYLVKEDGSCSRHTMTSPWVDACVPSNATGSENTFRFGVGDDMVEANSFEFNRLGTKVMMAVTSDTCVPLAEIVVSEDIDSKASDNGFIQNTLFFNVKVGIADSSVFYIPVSCNSSPVEGPLGPAL